MRDATAVPQAQINVRIDRELKRRGDEALAGVGVSPSRAVRMLWERLAACSHSPQDVLRVLDSAGASEAADSIEEEARHAELRAFVAEGPQIYARTLAAMGNHSSGPDVASHDLLTDGVGGEADTFTVADERAAVPASQEHAGLAPVASGQGGAALADAREQVLLERLHERGLDR